MAINQSLADFPVSSDFTIDTAKEEVLSVQYTRLNVTAPNNNQVPFILSVPGPLSLRRIPNPADSVVAPKLGKKEIK
tara:strand:- start:180 stop:410 length:231 start_codon:yes stop_codon:yes gene_type:complete